MNLGQMLDENAPKKGSKNASLQDLRWLETGLVQPGHPQFTPTGEVGDKDNNIKPALEVEWGYGDIAPLFSDQSAGAVMRNIPAEAQADAGPVILFARDQMNRGVAGKKLVASIRKKFTAKDIKVAKEGLRAQFALEGIVGCIAVDGRGYKDCKAAMEAASHSPFKKFIRHVIGCDCGTHYQLPSRDTRLKVADSKGGSVDEFLASGDNAGGLMVAYCQSTMLPVLAKGDLDESEMDQTMIDLMSIAGLPETAAGEIRNSKDSNLKKVQAAFRRIVSQQDRCDAEKYVGKIDTAGFVIDTEDRPVDLIEAIKRKEVAVNLKRSKLAELQIDSKAEELKTRLVFPPAEMPADVNEFVSQDVEMETFKEPEFENTDEIGLEDVLPGPGEVEVDLRQDMEI
jgi:hypothetical protein